MYRIYVLFLKTWMIFYSKYMNLGNKGELRLSTIAAATIVG